MPRSQRRPAPRRAALFVFVGFAACGAWWLARWQPARPQGQALADGFARTSGVVHVHTTLSDGGGRPEDVVAAARAAGLGFVFLTDHNTLDAKPIEGYREGVLVGVGTELSTTGGHLLALGLADPAFRISGVPEEALDDTRLLGAAAFAAHPSSPRPDFNWTGWDLPGPWGLEILNGDSQWREAGRARLAFSALTYGLSPLRALLASTSRPTALLERWDALLARRATPGLAGADAHGRMALGRRLSLPWPSYEAMFGLFRNHLLLEQPLSGQAGVDLEAVVGAMRAGRSYMAIDALCPADGFAFFVERGARRWTMGDTVSPAPGLRLRAGGPGPPGVEYLLLRDGRELLRSSALDLPVPGPGVYRVEGRAAGSELAWIVSNPIYVFDESVAAQRRQAAAWPEVSPAPASRHSLDLAGFASELDAASSVQRVLDPQAGRSGGPALSMGFRLARPPAGTSSRGWCALVSREPRDLSGASGFVLGLKADGVYRLWLQARDKNPLGSDAGSETWLASVRTSTGWQRLAVPFTRLRSLDPGSDGRFDPAQVTTLGLVLDDLTVKPGTSGMVAIDELGLY